MADHADHDTHINAEVAQARLEGLLEDGREQRGFEVDDLTNMHLLTVMTALNAGQETFHHNDSPEQAAFIQQLQAVIQNQNEEFFEELDDIHEPLEEQMLANAHATEGSPKPSFLRRIVVRTSPFSQSPDDWTLEDASWGLAMLMALIYGALAVANIVSLLGASAFTLPFLGDSIVWAAVLTGVSGAGLLAVVFVLGSAYGRTPVEGTEQDAPQ